MKQVEEMGGKTGEWSKRAKLSLHGCDPCNKGKIPVWLQIKNFVLSQHLILSAIYPCSLNCRSIGYAMIVTTVLGSVLASTKITGKTQMPQIAFLGNEDAPMHDKMGRCTR